MSSYLKINANGRVTCEDDSEKCRAIVSQKITHEWEIRKNANKYKLSVYAKTTGTFNRVNQYELPPPIDKILFYGDVFIIGYKKGTTQHKYERVDLNVGMWDMFCQHSFQYEKLKSSETADEQEIDELDLVPAHKKTKHGYLLDDFVVEDDEEEEEE